MKSVFLCIGLLATTALPIHAEATIERLQTDAGWQYDYTEIPDATGWKISIALPTHDHSNGQKALPIAIGGNMILSSGYEGMSSADKAAYFEDSLSNASFYDDGAAYWVDIYIDEDELDEVTAIMAQSFNTIEFDPDIFENQKSQIVPSLADYFSTPGGQATHIASTISSKNSGMTFTTQALMDPSLSETTVDDIQSWYENLLKTSGVKISVAGKAEPEMLNGFIDDLFAKFDPSLTTFDYPEPVFNYPNKLVVLEREGIDKSAIYMEIGLPAMSTNLQIDAASLLNVVLGGDDQSRLFRAVRDELRAAYAIGSGLDYVYANAPSIYIEGELDPKLQVQGYNAITEILTDLTNNGVTQDEFEAAHKQAMVNYDEMFTDENSAAYVMTDWQVQPYGDLSLLDAISETRAETYEQMNPEVKKIWEGGMPYIAVIVTPDATGLPSDCVIHSVDELETCQL